MGAKSVKKKDIEKEEIVEPIPSLPEPEKVEFYKTTVDLDKRKIDLFKEIMPGTSLKWFIDACLDSLIANYKHDVGKEIDSTVDNAVERVREGGLGK